MKNNILIIFLFLSFSISNAQIGIGVANPSPSAALELKSVGKGFLPPRLTTIQRNAITSPATGLMIYNSTKNCLEWYDGTSWYSGCGNQESSGGTAVVMSYNCTTASAGTLSKGVVVSGVTQTITANVTKVGTYTIQATTNGITFAGSGIFTATGLQDIVLTATGTPLAAETSNFILEKTPVCSFSRVITGLDLVGGNAICDGLIPTAIVPITSTTGKTWMDRNLGASRAGITFDDYLAYGCLYQWGRGNDGHASITWTAGTTGAALNGTTKTLATTDTPGNALFILTTILPSNWRFPQNDVLWQGVTGINNPCPAGYRIPTDSEFTAEINAYSITDPVSAIASPHKIVYAGLRYDSSGAIHFTGEEGNYWTSTTSNSEAALCFFNSYGASIDTFERQAGFSVRCIKD